MLKKVLFAGLLSAAAATTALAGTTIQGGGSTFAYPLIKAWGQAYYNKTGNKVNYNPSGSGAGIKAVIAREVDFGGSDKPLKPKALKKTNLYQWPLAVGAITFSYNIPGVKHLKLSEKAIEGILLGTITRWDDPVLKADNPGVNLPSKDIIFVHRSDSSGTTFAFTYYLSKMSKAWRQKIGARKLVNWPMPNHIGGKGNFGVATGIKTNQYSLGYVEYADARKSGLDMAEIQGADGQFIKPDPKTFAEGAKYADLDPKKDFYANIAYPPHGYPVISATFILAPKERKQKTQEVVKFADFGFSEGDRMASELGYIPLPSEVKEKIRAYWRKNGLY